MQDASVMIRLPAALLERAEALVPTIQASDYGVLMSIKRSAVLRLAIARGLALLEAEYSPAPAPAPKPSKPAKAKQAQPKPSKQAKPLPPIPVRERIEDVINITGITAKALAKQAGINPSVLSRWRNGSGKLSEKHHETLEHALDDALIQAKRP